MVPYLIHHVCNILCGFWSILRQQHQTHGLQRKQQLSSAVFISVGGTSTGFGKKSFRMILSNQKLEQALTSTPKAITRANTSCCLATSGDEHRGLSPVSETGFIKYLFYVQNSHLHDFIVCDSGLSDLHVCKCCYPKQ